MKDSARYASKIKTVLGGARDGTPPEDMDRLRLMLVAILEENATEKQAAAAVAAIEEEFVDFNELRVSPPKDIMDCVGDDYPGIRAKAENMAVALNAAFEHGNTLSLDYLLKKPKREVRKALAEQLHLGLYAEGVVTLLGFGGHAIPVDQLLLDGLKLEELIHPDSDLPDLQGFLERLVPNKDAIAAHQALRKFASKVAPRVWKDWEKRDKAIREEQARLAAEAEAKAAAQRAKEAEAAAKAAEAAAAKAAKLAKAKAAKAARVERSAAEKAARHAAIKKAAKKAGKAG